MVALYRVVYSETALNDIRSIYTYIGYELSAPDAADQLIRRIEEKIRKLNLFPEKYEIIPWEPWKSMNVRRMIVNRYTVLYSVGHPEQTVNILRIVYSSRDIRSLFDETCN